MTYFSVVSADAPSNWWRLADPGGIIGTDIGGAVHVPLFVSSAQAGPYTGPSSDGAATVHDTNNASLYNVTNPIPLLNLWTFECWAWFFHTGVDMTVMTIENEGAGFRNTIRYEAARSILFFSTLGASVVRYNGPVTESAWHHYALTYDHVTLRGYVDGVQQAAIATVINTSAQVSVRIGEEQGAAAKALGFFADAAYYNATLTAAQLLAHYNAADLVATNPIYLGGGTFDVTLGSSGGTSGDLDIIRQSVRKTYGL